MIHSSLSCFRYFTLIIVLSSYSSFHLRLLALIVVVIVNIWIHLIIHAITWDSISSWLMIIGNSSCRSRIVRNFIKKFKRRYLNLWKRRGVLDSTSFWSYLCCRILLYLPIIFLLVLLRRRIEIINVLKTCFPLD